MHACRVDSLETTHPRPRRFGAVFFDTPFPGSILMI